MVSPRYRPLTPLAMLVAMLLALPLHAAPAGQPAPAASAAARVTFALTIADYMRLANEQQSAEPARSEIDKLAQKDPLLRDEADLRRAELACRFDLGGAPEEAQAVLERLPNHPLAHKLRLQLARHWQRHADYDAALALLAGMLDSEPAADQPSTLALGSEIASKAPAEPTLRFYLAAARADAKGSESWLTRAASHGSAESAAGLREHPLYKEQPQLIARLLGQMARTALLAGRLGEAKTLGKQLADDFPASEEAAGVAHQLGDMRQARIGAILPLTGKHAPYGQDAERGLRMAAQQLGGEGSIELLVEDDASDPAKAIEAYQKLAAAGVALIVGPLSAPCTEALLEKLDAKLPVISLTGHPELAARSPALFAHSQSLGLQARHLAQLAFRQGDRRIAVLRQNGAEVDGEIADFRTAFEALGGQVVDVTALPEAGIDYRAALKGLRQRAVVNVVRPATDHPDVEPKYLPKLDGLYLALPGRTVALLASQLAYLDMGDLHLYGSSRWRDGHLLDDRGRYLGNALFTDALFPAEETETSRQLLLRYREAYGSGAPGKLFGLAFDTLTIAALLTGRMGLEKEKLIAALHDPAGFPALTGQVRFDADGIGEKRFPLFTLRDGNVVPAE